MIGLIVAAPLMRARVELSAADRLRDALLLGTAIPLFLATFGALNELSALLTLGCGLALRVRRHGIPRLPRGRSATGAVAGTAIPLAAIAAFAWPALVRPIMDGDSLEYHLPLAVTYAQTGTIWQTFAPYWWYPSGSELFAAGVVEVSEWGSVGVAGVLAAALLASRIVAWGAHLGAPRWVAGAVAAAVVSLPFARVEVASLQNDLWLTAFFLESLWALFYARSAAWQALALLSFVKPDGFVFALIAVAAAPRPRPRDVAACLVLPALWAARDIVLLPHAFATSGYAAHDLAATSVVSHGGAGFVVLLRALFAAGPPAVILLCAACGAAAFVRTRRLGLAALLCTALFVILPAAFESDGSQHLTTGVLRYWLPAVAVGGIALCSLHRRSLGLVATGLLFCVSIAIHDSVAVFWSDGTTRNTLAVVAVVAVAAAVPQRAFRMIGLTAVVGYLVVIANFTARVSPTAYFDDWLRSPGNARGALFAWLAAHPPARLVAVDIEPGAFSVTVPTALAIGPDDRDICAEALRARAVIVLANTVPPNRPALAPRQALRTSCGQVLYADPAGTVIRPHGERAGT